jgi:hypothetical protein
MLAPCTCQMISQFCVKKQASTTVCYSSRYPIVSEDISLKKEGKLGACRWTGMWPGVAATNLEKAPALYGITPAKNIL